MVRPVAHWQLPPEHAVVNTGSHWLPQLPQLSKLVFVSTHVPLHDVCPAVGHWHTPALQVEPVPHAFPQSPQFLASVWTSTQLPPHSRSDAVGHAQTPAVHARGAAQGLPQPPQFVALACVSTHVPPQSAVPALQEHFPAVQSAPLEPQLVAVRHSTHLPAALQYGVVPPQSPSVVHSTQMPLVVSHVRPVPQSLVVAHVFRQVWLARSQVMPAAQLSVERHSTQVCVIGSQNGVVSPQSALMLHPTQVLEAASQIGASGGQSVAFEQGGPASALAAPVPAPPAPVPVPPEPPLPLTKPPLPVEIPPSAPEPATPESGPPRCVEEESLEPQASSTPPERTHTATPYSLMDEDLMRALLEVKVSNRKVRPEYQNPATFARQRDPQLADAQSAGLNECNQPHSPSRMTSFVSDSSTWIGISPWAVFTVPSFSIFFISTPVARPVAS